MWFKTDEYNIQRPPIWRRIKPTATLTQEWKGRWKTHHREAGSKDSGGRVLLESGLKGVLVSFQSKHENGISLPQNSRRHPWLVWSYVHHRRLGILKRLHWYMRLTWFHNPFPGGSGIVQAWLKYSVWRENTHRSGSQKRNEGNANTQGIWNIY